jgi:hypothetical protein
VAGEHARTEELAGLLVELAEKLGLGLAVGGDVLADGLFQFRVCQVSPPIS